MLFTPSPEYSFAVTHLTLDTGLRGTGLVLTMGQGNDLVCQRHRKAGWSARWERYRRTDGRFRREIPISRRRSASAMARPAQRSGPSCARFHYQCLLRSLGEDKKTAVVEFTAQPFTRRDCESAGPQLSRRRSGQADCFADAHQLSSRSRTARMEILERGYPGYDTSVGWYHYDDDQVRENVQRSLDQGFGAFKLKVGGALQRDLQRAQGLRRLRDPAPRSCSTRISNGLCLPRSSRAKNSQA